MQASPAAKTVVIDRPFELELGGRLPALTIAYETWGDLRCGGDDAVLVIPAFSAHSHARSSTGDPGQGWWEHMIGPGAPIDSRRHLVICASLLGGCHGTSGPRSPRADTGRSWTGDFPLVTIGDLVRCHLLLLDHLGIDRLACAVGGSMGAMQSLELGLHHPERTRGVIAISGTDRTRPATAAIRHLGRKAIMNDPDFRHGRYEGSGPRAGLELAREIGTVFYRSKEEFNHRFDWSPVAEPSLGGITFDVQSYLRHQGRKAVGTFDANSYLRLSLAMDLHDVGRGRASLAELLAGNPVHYLIGGVREDRLLPVAEQREIHETLIAAGCRSSFREFTSPVGHDAFLVEQPAIEGSIRDFLAAL